MTTETHAICKDCADDCSTFERTGAHWKDAVCDICGSSGVTVVEITNAVPLEGVRKRPARVRPLVIPPVPAKDRPIEERFRVVGERWAKAAAYADLLEDLKGPTLEAIKSRIAREPGNLDLSDAKLERMAKADPEYLTHLLGLRDAREHANLEWVERKAVEIEERRLFDANANIRHEARLGRG